jgi:hypothetical protein
MPSAAHLGGQVSLEPVRRHRFASGSEPQILTANLCETYEVKCSARGGHELCPGFRDYDPVIMEGGMAVRPSGAFAHVTASERDRPAISATIRNPYSYSP